MAGEQADFDEFYSARVRGLTVQLYAYLGDMPEAQDIVHEAFTKAFMKWHQLRDYEEPLAWVRRVAWNLATNHLRKQRNQHVDGPDPDRVALTRALATLPANHRLAVVLHYHAQMSVAEIAEQVGVAEGTVKSWLSRGRTALASVLRKESSDDRVR